MQDSLLYIILVLIGVVIYLLVTQRKNKEEPKDNTQELNNLKEINNIKFNFIQKIGKKTESGSCIISYPKKILCRYEDLYKKILVSNGKSLIIN